MVTPYHSPCETFSSKFYALQHILHPAIGAQVSPYSPQTTEHVPVTLLEQIEQIISGLRNLSHPYRECDIRETGSNQQCHCFFSPQSLPLLPYFCNTF